MDASVVIPVKNAVRTLGRTLASLKQQSTGDFETIVVDGGSTDGTLEVIGNAQLPRLTLISDLAGGITSAVNKGVRAAASDVVVPWLCADDYLDPKFIESMVASLKRTPAAGFAFGNWHTVDGDRLIKSRTPDENWTRKLRYVMPLVLPNSFAFRRSLFLEHGYLEESLKFANDYDFLRRLHDAGVTGVYNREGWYYFQVGGLSQSRHFECAREVARTAVRHGSAAVPTQLYFLKGLLATKASYLLNSLRRRNSSSGSTAR